MNVSGHKTMGASASVSTQLEVTNASALEEPMATTPWEMAASSPQLQVSKFHFLLTSLVLPIGTLVPHMLFLNYFDRV